MITPKGRLSPEVVHDQRAAMVKQMVEKESAAQDAKTIRLKALRLAKEAQDRAAAPAPSPKPKPKSKSRR